MKLNIKKYLLLLALMSNTLLPWAQTASASEVEPVASASDSVRENPWKQGEQDALGLAFYAGVNKSVNEHLPFMDWTAYPFAGGGHIGLEKEWTPLWGWRLNLGYDVNKARRTRTCEERTWYGFHSFALMGDITLDLTDLIAPQRPVRTFNAKMLVGAGLQVVGKYPHDVPLSYIYPYNEHSHATFGMRAGLLLHYRVHPQLSIGLELSHLLALDEFSGVTDWKHTAGVVNPDPVSPLDGRTNLLVGFTWTPQPKIKKKTQRKEQPVPSKAEADSLLQELELIVPEAHEVAVRTLSGKAFLDFPVNETIIYPNYRANPSELKKLENSIEEVLWDPTVQILSIRLHGYASPESPYANNERLARARSFQIRAYVMEKYNISADIIQVEYTPEDWDGLRRYVEEKLQQRSYRAEILALIDTPMDADEKEAQLKRIGGGRPYQELYAHAYPALRHTDYTITYQIEDNKAPLDVKKLLYRHPEHLSLGDITREAITYDEGSDEWFNILQIAVRQFPEDPIALYNAGVACLRTHRLRDARTLLTNKLLDGMEAAEEARKVLELMQ